jgi:PTS system cellobiose-specific IIA component
MKENIMELIIHGGNAHSYAMEALTLVRENKFDQANNLIKLAEAEQELAHKIQTEFITEMASESLAGGNSQSVDILLVHALDHVASGLISIDFSKELISLYEKMSTNKSND